MIALILALYVLVLLVIAQARRIARLGAKIRRQEEAAIESTIRHADWEGAVTAELHTAEAEIHRLMDDNDRLAAENAELLERMVYGEAS